MKRKKELFCKEIQQISLEILLDVHRFCVEHGIHYSLAYGTLIGAARHKGFVPWDDDIDIVLTRPEYDRLCREYKSDKYRLVPVEESWVAYSRVCDTELTTLVSTCPWTWKRGLGVCIDVFPIDGVSDIPSEFSAQINELAPFFPKQYFFRSLHQSLTRSMTWKRMAKMLVRRYLYWNGADGPNAKIAEIAARYPFGSTGHCSQLVCEGNKDREFFDNSFFDGYTTLPFEGHDLMVARGWEEMLRLNYGDYMQLPPAEARVNHSTYMHYFWR